MLNPKLLNSELCLLAPELATSKKA